MIDWNQVRKFRHVTESSPPEWPAGVKAISLEGVTLLGIHQSTGELYWDGQAVVTEKRLANYERRLALAVTIATGVMAVIEAGRAAGWITH
ncbi:hypothetical protein EJ066_24965 [Mesorhizobium sp. M9A.F.Ca.ET.002.03.1.2]|uniref:hypothetical protein n=1 Tax=Mesorhizobium sp. M9A.F.Ca.ET.002.03.1.2 TaxID=2493668 RepID=UPI000F75BD96|nr:hypothetical protein [Mesorhizobium sp. M9A.F.Ca.ET.002.03.1.2]AZO00114.1 hypothetical protein EJ066_24965 [Mesorhizobium sp. M9A.F.Ca.ET.002.03.1.2]